MTTVRRDWLLRKGLQGKLVMSGAYHFDDMLGESRSSEQLPVVIYNQAENPDWWRNRKEGAAYIGTYNFTGSGGRAWKNADGTITLHVHSNCSYTFKVLP